jgi:hypothetical protein
LPMISQLLSITSLLYEYGFGLQDTQRLKKSRMVAMRNSPAPIS